MLAELPSDGHKEAPATSRKARACCSAACAPWMLVLDRSACLIKVLSSGSSKRSHQDANDAWLLVGGPSKPDQVTGTSKPSASLDGVGTEAQAHSASASRLAKPIPVSFFGL